jgi:creatinine amidohydrolase
MFPDELEEARRACPVVYFAYGLCEPHGPQAVLGLDGLKAHAIACRAAQRHGGIVAPPDYWHVHEIGTYGYWGWKKVGEVPHRWLTAVPPWIHFKNICYHIRAADQNEFHAAILITGHYGPNWKDLKTLTDRIQPYVAVRLYGLPDFEANVPGFAEDGESGGDHAGRVETSLLWALEPECVDASRVTREPEFAMGPNAAESNRRTGERMVEDEVRWLGRKAEELLAAYKPKPGRLATFQDVEDFWAREMEPHVGDLASMQPRDEDRGEMPEDSIWYPNWRLVGPPD